MDSIEAAVGTEIETELLEATGSEGATVWCCCGVVVQVGQDVPDSVCVERVFSVV